MNLGYLLVGMKRPGRVSQYPVIDAHRATYSLRLLCRALSVAASSYHRWDAEGRHAKKRRDDAVEQLVGEIRRVFVASGETYGAIKVREQLARDGVRCTSSRTAEPMAANDMTGISGRDKTTTTTRRDRLAAPLPDLVGREFQPAEPTTLWNQGARQTDTSTSSHLPNQTICCYVRPRQAITTPTSIGGTTLVNNPSEPDPTSTMRIRLHPSSTAESSGYVDIM